MDVECFKKSGCVRILNMNDFLHTLTTLAKHNGKGLFVSDAIRDK